jgi:hypothetical protein
MEIVAQQTLAMDWLVLTLLSIALQPILHPQHILQIQPLSTASPSVVTLKLDVSPQPRLVMMETFAPPILAIHPPELAPTFQSLANNNQPTNATPTFAIQSMVASKIKPFTVMTETLAPPTLAIHPLELALSAL